MEALQKEFWDEDNLAVGWAKPGGRDFLTRGGVTQDWLDAVWSARSQLGLPPVNSPTTVNGVNNIYPKRATSYYLWNVLMFQSWLERWIEN